MKQITVVVSRQYKQLGYRRAAARTLVLLPGCSLHGLIFNLRAKLRSGHQAI